MPDVLLCCGIVALLLLLLLLLLPLLRRPPQAVMVWHGRLFNACAAACKSWQGSMLLAARCLRQCTDTPRAPAVLQPLTSDEAHRQWKKRSPLLVSLIRLKSLMWWRQSSAAYRCKPTSDRPQLELQVGASSCWATGASAPTCSAIPARWRRHLDNCIVCANIGIAPRHPPAGSAA